MQVRIFNGGKASREEKHVEMLVFSLVAPLIVYSSEEAGENTADEAWVRDAKLSRLLKCMRGDLSEQATDFEAMIYLSTASLVHPLDTPWYNIYMYLFSKHYPESKQLGFNAPKSLSTQEQTMLTQLKEWIFERQKEAVKAKLKKPVVQKTLDGF